jgi:nitrous oxidase accessory protein NosD
MITIRRYLFPILVPILALAVQPIFSPASSALRAATLCVNPNGSGGCFTTIGAAVAAASPGDTILVAHGTYKETVTIRKSLSLLGANKEITIIDATGQGVGIFIDGTASAPNSGVSDVTVAGFAVRNANFEGILVANASYVTIFDNQVTDSNLALNAAAATCSGIPDFETNEGFDCGEGIHLMGVDHSVVSHNISENNAGGILLSDDTGATHDNLITGNAVRNNPFDCGVTLASHGPATITGAALPFGVFHNTISDNESARNGLHVPGAGAGVGIFAPFPGTKAYGNVVTHNRLIGNGLPGVAMHNHASFPMAPPVDLSSNVIVGNFFLGNGADTEDAATPGPTGINIFSIAPVIGTVIAENVFVDEAIDVAVSTPSLLDSGAC